MISGYNQLVNCYIVLDSSGNQVISMPICVPIIDSVLRAVIVQAIGSYFFYVSLTSNSREGYSCVLIYSNICSRVLYCMKKKMQETIYYIFPLPQCRRFRKINAYDHMAVALMYFKSYAIFKLYYTANLPSYIVLDSLG